MESHSVDISVPRVDEVRCTKCGGAMPFQLHAVLTCPYCGAVDAVETALLESITKVREHLAERGRQLASLRVWSGMTQRTFWVTVLESFQLRFMLGWWAFALLFELVCVRFGGRVSFWDLLTMTGWSNLDTAVAWTLMFFTYIAVLASVGIALLGVRHKFRRDLRVLASLPPRAPGAPPRCRCCLAELPGQGAIRRCSYCGTEHVVFDDRYRAAQQTIDQAIRNAWTPIREEGLAIRESSTNLVWLVTLLPFVQALPLLLLVFPESAHFDPSARMLIPVHVACGLLAVPVIDTSRRLLALRKAMSLKQYIIGMLERGEKEKEAKKAAGGDG